MPNESIKNERIEGPYRARRMNSDLAGRWEVIHAHQEKPLRSRISSPRLAKNLADDLNAAIQTERNRSKSDGAVRMLAVSFPQGFRLLSAAGETVGAATSWRIVAKSGPEMAGEIQHNYSDGKKPGVWIASPWIDGEFDYAIGEYDGPQAAVDAVFATNPTRPDGGNPTTPTESHHRTAEAIIDRYRAGDSVAELADDFDLTTDTICLIVSVGPDGEDGAAFVKAGTPESEALCVHGDHFAAQHVGGTTWRFGRGDKALDDQVGAITLARHGDHDYAVATARWIVNALDATATQPDTPDDGSTEKRELLCELCGVEHDTWFAPNPIWNAVMRDGQAGNPDAYSFVCPTCFINRAKSLGVGYGGWFVADEDWQRGIAPGGRLIHDTPLAGDEPADRYVVERQQTAAGPMWNVIDSGDGGRCVGSSNFEGAAIDRARKLNAPAADCTPAETYADLLEPENPEKNPCINDQKPAEEDNMATVTMTCAICGEVHAAEYKGGGIHGVPACPNKADPDAGPDEMSDDEYLTHIQHEAYEKGYAAGQSSTETRINEAAERLGAVQAVPYAAGVFPDGSWMVTDATGDDTPRRDAEAATFFDALIGCAALTQATEGGGDE